MNNNSWLYPKPMVLKWLVDEFKKTLKKAKELQCKNPGKELEGEASKIEKILDKLDKLHVEKIDDKSINEVKKVIKVLKQKTVEIRRKAKQEKDAEFQKKLLEDAEALDAIIKDCQSGVRRIHDYNDQIKKLTAEMQDQKRLEELQKKIQEMTKTIESLTTTLKEANAEIHKDVVNFSRSIDNVFQKYDLQNVLPVAATEKFKECLSNINKITEDFERDGDIGAGACDEFEKGIAILEAAKQEIIKHPPVSAAAVTTAAEEVKSAEGEKSEPKSREELVKELREDIERLKTQLGTLRGKIDARDKVKKELDEKKADLVKLTRDYNEQKGKVAQYNVSETKGQLVAERGPQKPAP